MLLGDKGIDFFGGLVLAHSSTTDGRAHVDQVTATGIDSAYRWIDTVRKDGLMIAIARPMGHSIARCDPQLEEGTRCEKRIAVCRYLRSANRPGRGLQ